MSSNLNGNKIAAAIVMAGLIAMVGGKVTEFLYDGGPAHPGAGHEEARGYKIEVTEVAPTADGKPAGASDITALYATADAKAGADFYSKKCAVCHNIEKGSANKVGPHLWGIIGNKVAAVADFNYSAGMKSHGDRTWTFDEMNHFQWNPRAWVPGTIMGYSGTPKDSDRANLIVYLNSQSDKPLPLPKAK
jgi:cytochrome c